MVFVVDYVASALLNVNTTTDTLAVIRIFENASAGAQRVPIILLTVVIAPIAGEVALRGYLLCRPTLRAAPDSVRLFGFLSRIVSWINKGNTAWIGEVNLEDHFLVRCPGMMNVICGKHENGSRL
jgi:hypothetical protein